MYVEGGEFGSMHDSDFQDKKPRQHVNQRPAFHSSTNPLPRKNSSLDLYVDSTGEASAFNSTKIQRMGTKHGSEGMRSNSASNPCDHYEGVNLAIKQTDSLLHGYDNSNLKNVQRSEYVKSKPPTSIHKSQIYLDTEERGLKKMVAKVHEYICTLFVCASCNQQNLLFTDDLKCFVGCSFAGTEIWWG